MTITFNKTRLLLASLFLAAASAGAEDIDIYVSPPSVAERPNVIILIDSSSSNNSAGNANCAGTPIASGGKLIDMVKCGVYKAVDALGTQPALMDRLNLGVMIYGEGSNQGGQWLSPSPAPSSITGLTFMNAAGVAATKPLAAGLTTGNSRAAPSIFQETWALLSGGTGKSGAGYTAPPASCAKTFIIFIGADTGNGGPAVGTNNLDLTDAAIGATAAQKTQINSSYLGASTGKDFVWTDEWARLLRANFSARTYTIAATGADGIPEAEYLQHMRSMANVGGGKSYIAANTDDLVRALLQIFNEVQSVNSVFASSSLPVSVNAQGTYLNQIFMGMFRPDPAGLPRWFGNLKQFQFGLDLTNPNRPALFLADKTGAKALSSAGTGFISANAVSFWSDKNVATSPDAPPPVGTNGYFVNNPQGASNTYDSPDGEVVEKGGVAQQIRLENLTDNYTTNLTTPRRLYTCTGSCAVNSSLSGTPFATSNASITAAALGTGTPGTTITSISRTATLATVTLASAPSPAYATGNTISISGSSVGTFNGSFNITVLTPTTFTYAITENPPVTATNTYTASIPIVGSGSVTVTSLTRAGTTVTVIAPAHGFSTGNTVSISGSTSSYNTNGTPITKIDANTFTYALPGAEGPTTPPSVLGTFTIGATYVNQAMNSLSRAASTVVLGVNQSVVTVCKSGANIAGVTVGNNVVIAGVTPNAYTLGPLASGAWAITSITGKCFTFNMPTTPASPGTVIGVTAANAAPSVDLTILTRTATTCPATTVAIATATTSTAHPFITGDNVTLAFKAGTTPSTGEGVYTGTFTITKVDSTHFTYPITVTPACISTGGTASLSGAVGRDTLIKWVRGEDNFLDEPSPGGTITVRPSIHGDVLHSRPTVINYGGSTGVVVFYGTNDGIFRAINGNNGLFSATTIGGVPMGGELWGFIPTEFYSKLFRVRQNTPIVKFATTSTAIVPAPTPKDYFFDGPTGVYQNGATAYIYMAARRGGRLLYALNVSDPTNPKLLWKKTNADSGFAELGQTWSQPTVMRVRGYTNPVLVFGAGYSPNQDSEPPGIDTMGRGIFILDATTGAILWRAGPGGASNTCTVTAGTAATTGCQLGKMTYSIPADITPIDRDSDGCIDRIYAADTGGNIWRVDFEAKATVAASAASKCGDGTVLTGAEPKDWQATLFAELGGATTDTTKRKFFFPPDVVVTDVFDAVLAATGDREHPLRTVSGSAATNAYAIFNKFYMIKDTLQGKDGSSWTSVTDTSSSTVDGLDPTPNFFNATSLVYPDTFPLKGFTVKLSNTGEKGVNAPLTVGGLTFFGTNQPVVPSATSCEPNLGTARGYQVNFLTGAKTNVVFDGGGLPPSPVSGLVEVGGRIVPFIIGGGNPDAKCVGPDCDSALGGLRPPISITGVRKRTFWYQERDK